MTAAYLYDVHKLLDASTIETLSPSSSDGDDDDGSSSSNNSTNSFVAVSTVVVIWDYFTKKSPSEILDR